MSDRSAACVLGVDLGSSKIALSLWSGQAPIARDRFETIPGGATPNLDEIARRARDLSRGAGVDCLHAVGVSAGGPTDPHRGVILTVPNQSGWNDVPIVERLSSALDAPVAVENDANACALAEWRYGAGRGANDVVFLTFSTGLGAGLILDGRLYRGQRFLAGEIGHHVIVPDGAACGCGRRGCLEAYASGSGIRRLLEERRVADPGGDWPDDARGLVDRAREGVPAFVELLEEVSRFLARGLAGLIFTLNPERIVLGTIAVGAGELILAPLRRELERLVWPSLLEGLDIRAAELGRDLGDWAAFTVGQSRTSI